MVLHVVNLQSDESHMNSEPSAPPHFTAAFDSEELQHLSYCCQHLDSATELSYESHFPFLSLLYICCFLSHSSDTQVYLLIFLFSPTLSFTIVLSS